MTPPMTDTIDVAALGWQIANEQWMSTSEKAALAKRIDDAIATALQSQADALAEARRDLAKMEQMFASAIEVASDQQDRATTAESSLATMREALEPFANFIGDDTRLPDTMPLTQGSSMARKQVTVADFRRARRALGGSNAE